MGFLVTERCTAACRHCSVRAHPGGRPAADPESVRRWAESVAGAPGVRSIGITGGEPFLEKPALRILLDAAQRHDLRAAVFTNAYWAVDARRARAILADLPPIHLLQIGADPFHEEFVPLRRLRVAAEAALDLGISMWFQLDGSAGEGYERRLRDTLGAEVCARAEFTSWRLLDAGRARDQVLNGHRPVVPELPRGRCIVVNSPLVGPDGTVMACCGEEAYGAGGPPALVLGSLRENDFTELSARACGDPVLLALRVAGPAYLARLATALGWRPAMYRQERLCDLCRELLGDPALLERLREKLRTPEEEEALFLGDELLKAEVAASAESGVPE